jgi:hypothetical protein
LVKYSALLDLQGARGELQSPFQSGGHSSKVVGNVAGSRWLAGDQAPQVAPLWPYSNGTGQDDTVMEWVPNKESEDLGEDWLCHTGSQNLNLIL